VTTTATAQVQYTLPATDLLSFSTVVISRHNKLSYEYDTTTSWYD